MRLPFISKLASKLAVITRSGLSAALAPVQVTYLRLRIWVGLGGPALLSSIQAPNAPHDKLSAMLYGFSLWWFVVGLTLRPYAPPVLGPEPSFFPPENSIVEVMPSNGEWDANVLVRPHYMAPLVGHVARGTRLRVRGELSPPDGSYCATGLYYAIEPFGWICSADTQPTSEPATTESVLQVVEGTPVPYRYAMVVVQEGTTLPMWGSLEALFNHESPERELGRGDTLALSPTVDQFEEASYYVTVDGKIVPVKGTVLVKKFSEWQGVPIDASVHLPFGWVTPNKAPVFDAPKGNKIDELVRRTRVDVLEETQQSGVRWLRIGEGRYIKADHLNEVRKLDRPEGSGTHHQWIDVDLGEQVVVAYRDNEPAYATLTSSGREPNHTPRGNYPVWGKSSAITMKSQEYDDAPYYVNRVPWVLFFQAHNALHAAYWHDRFGAVKSHGCANLAPRDAQYLFEWLDPKLPAGWTSVRYWDLSQAPVVHVRNSRRSKPFTQERNIGPPDKDDETGRVEAALVRREAKEREEAAQFAAQQGAAPGLPATPVPLLPPSPLLY